MNNSALSPFTAFALKTVGVILVLSSLLDYMIVLIPFDPLEQTWQIQVTTQIVDRGIIPMVGISFLLVGYWVGSMSEDLLNKGSSFLDLRFLSFVLCAFLGLIFLLLVPLHINNISRVKADALTQIEQGAGQAETQIQTQSAQIEALLQNEEQLEQLDAQIAAGEARREQLNPRQLQQLTIAQNLRERITEFQQDPEALARFVEERETTLGDRRLEAEKQANTEATKRIASTGISSFLLAIGYSAVGWLGLKGFTTAAAGSRRR